MNAVRSLSRWYWRPSRGKAAWAAVFGWCCLIQGIAQHFTGKHYGWLPPWAQITEGALLLIGAIPPLVSGPRKPPVPPVEVPYFGTLPERTESVFPRIGPGDLMPPR